MRSLFAKIFLWFWLSITAVIATLVLVTWLYPYSAVPNGTLPDRLHELQVRGALAVYELQGPAAFEQHRRQLEQASHLRTYFLDGSGRELSGQAVPDSLRQFADEHRAEIDDGERVMIGQPSRLAIPVVGREGTHYLALVQGGGSRGFGPGPGPFSDGPQSRPGELGGGRGSERGMEQFPERGGGSTTQPDRGDGTGGGPGGGRGGGRGPDRGGGRGPSQRPPESLPRFELLVPAHVLLLRLLAVVLAAGLGCYALARYLTSPVRQLQTASRRLAAGDLTTRVGTRLAARRDEIGELGRDFDRMAGQVENLLNTQRRLLQDVSHELRSPLARLNVALELAARDAGAAAGPALARVGREAERLNGLIGQLLTLARLEGGGSVNARPAQTRIDLHELVSEVVEDAEFEASSRNRHVRIIRCDKAIVGGEPNLLRSAIENVVRNAIRHTTEGTTVEVALTVSTDAPRPIAQLEVRDHGPGVPAESLQRIFQPFYRVSDGRERESGGAGLGLSIAQRAIQLHAGNVEASNAPDGGLTVRIQLPCESPIG